MGIAVHVSDGAGPATLCHIGSERPHRGWSKGIATDLLLKMTTYKQKEGQRPFRGHH